MSFDRDIAKVSAIAAVPTILDVVSRTTGMVNRVYHLDRGFERLEEKLSACGASIQRISD